jgi:hypothetical protein
LETTQVCIISIQDVLLIFKNNSISAQNSNSQIVMFGSQASGSNDHKLDSLTIVGNKIVWTGNDLADNNDGMVVAYSVNANIKYNYIQNCPYGISTKSNGFTYTSGGIGYNIFESSFKVGAAAKGMNGVKFYNNTFYNTRNVNEGVIGSVYIVSNFDDPSNLPSTNCQVYNNVFYTKHQVANIYCDMASLTGLQCDYNLYWCEDGEPVFKIAGKQITFSQWQAMGYDTHSVVINPNFVDFTSLVPSAPLNVGKDLGLTWQNGLAINNLWNQQDPFTNPQGAAWQVGAYVR